jgi:hypothetical protein
MGMKRAFAGVIYLGATLIWALLMGLNQAMRCDDSCTAAQYARSWRDNVDSWQYGVIGWLGLAGLTLAVLAVSLSFARRWIGFGLLAAHASVFTANCLVFYLGRPIYSSFVPFALVASLVAAAGFVAVRGWSRQREAPHGGGASFPADGELG